ncbi:thiolase-like protein [Cadophora sp. DSE1049]|nr:thiolase-like protein [Cadophora sp. DSE1049]
MSPSRDTHNGTNNQFGELNLAITGLGVEYPPYQLYPEALDTLCKRHYPDTPAMTKVRAINNYTGIDSRSATSTVDHPMANMDRAPTITELCEIFLKDGVALAVTAARKALHEAQLSPADITHVVSTTCTNSANPGFDHYVCKGLGITQPVEKVLLSFRGRKARVLVIALEISSLLVRSELDSVHELQETRIGITLFSNCASALVLSNGIGGEDAEPVYDLLGWDHRVIPDTEQDLGFDVDPLGVERAMSISAEHMRASYDTYINHGDSSSATIISVMGRLRQKDMDELPPGGRVKDFVVGCAFGPGIAIEMCMLKRNLNHVRRTLVTTGEATPPETESEGTTSEGEAEEMDADIKDAKEKGAQLNEKLNNVHSEVPEQGDSLSEALNGVDLD